LARIIPNPHLRTYEIWRPTLLGRKLSLFLFPFRFKFKREIHFSICKSQNRGNGTVQPW
jgi:hypothetical protein